LAREPESIIKTILLFENGTKITEVKGRMKTAKAKIEEYFDYDDDALEIPEERLAQFLFDEATGKIKTSQQAPGGGNGSGGEEKN